MKRFVWMLAVLILVFAPQTAEAQQRAAPDSSSARPAPTPELAPEEVVRLQLEALAENDTPYENAGIETAFHFASPANRRATGPLRRFIALVNNPVYKPMIDHTAARYGEGRALAEGRVAQQPVILTGPDGERAGYVFTLSKQRGGPWAGCWMTDGVERVPLGEAPSGETRI